TGIPKGVKITRKSIVNYIQYYTDKSNMTSEDTFALYASIGFDVGAIKSIFVSMFVGACLNIIPEEIRLDMNKLNNHFINNNITHAHLPTQVAKLFIDEFETSSLKILVTGGEKLGEIDYSTDYMLVDSYGPTEACVSVTAIKEENKIDHTSIGNLLYNIKAYVLDDERRRVPVGAVGELYLAGYQIADGYLNREKENGEAFIDNPFDENKDYGVLYRSGDMVRVLNDRTLAIVGRRDKQVKIRGNRVELPEIESVIREISYVEDVTVQTIKRGSNYDLVAYVVASGDINNIEDNICKHIAESKPDYMVPAVVIKLDQIPLNVNGKVDKKKLPKGIVSSKVVAPKNKTEQEILEICWNLLENTDFGVTDNLLSLGFSSLTYMNLNYEIYSKFKINLNFSELIECKTVRSISEIFSNDNVSKFKKYEKRELYPLTKDQIVVYESRAENPFAFKASYAIKIFDVDVDKLKKAFIKFLDRHPFLKSTLTTINDKHYIKREDEWDGSNLIRISKVGESEFDLFEEKVVLQENDYIFDRYFKEDWDSYQNKFLYCVMVENKNKVFMSIFLDHLFCDNYSLSLMFNEIDKIYNNQEYKIKEEIIDGFDYNMFYYEDEIKTSDLYEKFKKDVMGYGDLYIPPIREYDNDWCQHNSLSIVLEDKQSIQNFCKKHNLPFNHLFMATFVLALYKYCNLSKGILPVISNGRFFNELMNTQHYIAKTIYLKFKTKSWTSFGDVIDNIDDEMKRIIKSEPNSFKLTYFNQWIFNFIESYEIDDLNLTMVDYKKQFNRPRLIKNVGVNFINDVIIFEMHDQYHVNIKYHNMRFTDEYIGEFIGYWINIIKYVLLKDEMDLNLEFLDEI
uniref:AMP-binding protein n=1 Tax=Methanobrevibacter sp. TaxID=66852 RepID=UPI00388F2472